MGKSNLLGILALAAMFEVDQTEYNPRQELKPRPKGTLTPSQQKKKAKARKKRKNKKR